VWQDAPQKNGTPRKRELLNKFAKCIGAKLSHLVLSGLIFCQRTLPDENDFQKITLILKKHHTSQNRGGVLRIDARWPDEPPVISTVGDSKK
jgi:hypothetical protein